MTVKTNTPANHETRAKQAFTAMAEIRGSLYRRLVDYVLSHERRLRDEVSGEDSYSYTLQQMDEQFLTKLNVIERAVGELARFEPRDGQVTTTTYETIEVVAKRDELPQKIAEVLAEHGESDFLDLCVLRADDQKAEVLVLLAREDCGPPPAAHRPAQHPQGGQSEQGEDQAGNAGT